MFETLRTVSEIGLVLRVMFLQLPSDLREVRSSKRSQLFWHKTVMNDYTDHSSMCQ